MSKIVLLVEIDEEDYGDFCDWFESIPSSVDGFPCVKGKFNTALYDAKPYDDSGDLISRSALKKEVENLVVGGAEGLKDYYENGSKADENSWIGGVYDTWELINNATPVDVISN